MSTPSRIAFVTLAFAFAGAASAADGQRAFAIEDLYRVQTPSAPAVSPDGNSVVYTLTSSDP